VREHIGIDVFAGPRVDIVIRRGEPWPLSEESFHAVLCTQVLEHVVDLDHVVGEIHRVLKPGALLVVSVPFAYNEHGAPHDYRRFSAHGLRLEFERDYEILEIRRQGGIASTCIVLALNWWDTIMDRSRPTRLLKGLTLPAWVLLSGFLNSVGFLLDKLDGTDAFYGNVLLVARKRAKTLT
jgi:SAM-dependent methyltransferase